MHRLRNRDRTVRSLPPPHRAGISGARHLLGRLCSSRDPIPGDQCIGTEAPTVTKTRVLGNIWNEGPARCVVCGEIISRGAVGHYKAKRVRGTCSDACALQTVATRTAAAVRTHVAMANPRAWQDHPCPVCGATVPAPAQPGEGDFTARPSAGILPNRGGRRQTRCQAGEGGN